MIVDVIILLGLLFLEPVLAIYRYAVRKALPYAVTVTLSMGASFLYGLAIILVTWLMIESFVQSAFQDFLLGGVILGGVFALICAYTFLIKAIRSRTNREGSNS